MTPFSRRCRAALMGYIRWLAERPFRQLEREMHDQGRV
jgi:hypothetical protein